MRIFLTTGMGKHAYSDQTFYDENNEIFASIYPKAFRIVAWTGNVSTLFRPPSMGYEQSEYSLFVKLSTDIELFKKGTRDYDVSIKCNIIKICYYFSNVFIYLCFHNCIFLYAFISVFIFLFIYLFIFYIFP